MRTLVLSLALVAGCSASQGAAAANTGNALLRAIHAVCRVANQIPDNAIPVPMDAGVPAPADQ